MTTSIENLAATWASLDQLLDGLSDDEWERGTGCPGWSVKDHVAHLVDYEARALGRDAPPAVDGVPPAHVKNALGASNEQGVAARRAATGAEVLAELRSVTAERLAQLRALTETDLAWEIDLPIGRGTMADMLTLRVMDTWSHEQDIRRALGRPGHTSGPVVDEAVAYFSRFLPIVVVKRAGAPEGAVVVFDVEGRTPFAVVVQDGRGAVVSPPPRPPTVELRMSVTAFDGLVCGRSDIDAADVEIGGDAALGARVVAALAFIP